jgi:hypothetical protein
MTVEYFENYWRPNQTNGLYATPIRKSSDGATASGSLVFKGTYVNIQNVVLGYTLPSVPQYSFPVRRNFWTDNPRMRSLQNHSTTIPAK